MKFIKTFLAPSETEGIEKHADGFYYFPSGNLWDTAAQWKYDPDLPGYWPVAGMYMRCIVREDVKPLPADVIPYRTFEVVFFDLGQTWEMGRDQTMGFVESWESLDAMPHIVQTQRIDMNDSAYEPDWDGPRPEAFHVIMAATASVLLDDEVLGMLEYIGKQYARDLMVYDRRSRKLRPAREA